MVESGLMVHTYVLSMSLRHAQYNILIFVRLHKNNEL